MSTPAANSLIDRFPTRLLRFLGFSTVGASGMVVDLAITFTLLSAVGYIGANTAGFLVAVTWNFAGNWLFVFGRPSGSIARQYGSYVALHSLTFALRLALLAVMIELLGVPILLATVLAVAAAAVANYLGTESILTDRLELLDAVAALHSIAHRCYSSRVRALLRSTGLYGLAYQAYMTLLGWIYAADRIDIQIGDTTATMHSESAEETLSILHTVEKEEPILQRFIAEVEADDVVWDVGANLGVYASLAGAQGATPLAFEPIAETADRLRENLALNADDYPVRTVALSDRDGESEIALERDDLGTQTPALDAEAISATETRTVQLATGDELVADGLRGPDALKVDVEGAEVAVIKGLEEQLSDLRFAVVECHDDAAATTIQDMFTAAGHDVEIAETTGTLYVFATPAA